MEGDILKERIIQYLDGELSKEEERVFEGQIKQDQQLSDEVDQYIRTKLASYDSGRQEQKAALLDQWEAWEAQQQASVRPLFRTISVAAAIALLIGLGFFLLKPKPSLSPEGLFAIHYEHPDAHSIRDIDSAALSIATAHHAYAEGKFEEARTLYQSLLDKSDLKSDEINYFLGICYLKLNDTDAAIRQWSQIDSDQYRRSGRWYTTLAMVRQGKLQEAKQACQELIEEGDSYYKSRAEALLKDLN